MRENLRIGSGPVDIDRFGCVHLDDANYAAVRIKRNSEGRSSIDQTSSRKPSQDSDIPYAIPKRSLVKIRDCAQHRRDGGMFPPSSLFRAKQVTRRVVRKAYLSLPGKVCSGGNSRGKPVAWPGG